LFLSHVNAPSTCQDARWLGRSMKDLRGECKDGKEKSDDGQGQSDLGCTSVSPFCFRSTHQAATPSTPSRQWTCDLIFNHIGFMHIYIP
jgi:hypothetical protein